MPAPKSSTRTGSAPSRCASGDWAMACSSTSTNLLICRHLRAIAGTRRCCASVTPSSARKGVSSDSAWRLARSWAVAGSSAPLGARSSSLAASAFAERSRGATASAAATLPTRRPHCPLRLIISWMSCPRVTRCAWWKLSATSRATSSTAASSGRFLVMSLVRCRQTIDRWSTPRSSTRRASSFSSDGSASCGRPSTSRWKLLSARLWRSRARNFCGSVSDGWAAVGEFIGRLSALKWHWPRHTDDPSDGEYC